MEEVRTAAGPAVDVRLAPDDLGDHRQRPDGRGQGVRQSDGEQVAIEVGLPPPRIHQLDRLGAEQRLQASDQAKEDDVLHPGGGRHPAEVGERERFGRVFQNLRHIHQEPRPDFVLGRVVQIEEAVREQVAVPVFEVECDPQPDRHDEDDQLGRHFLHPCATQERQTEQDEQADQANDRDLGVDAAESRRQAGVQLQRSGPLLRDRADYLVGLLGDDDEPDRGEHPVDRREREEVGQPTGPE